MYTEASALVRVYGDTFDEMVVAALVQAQDFFPEGATLSIEPGWSVRGSGGTSGTNPEGKKYFASITVLWNRGPGSADESVADPILDPSEDL